MAPLGARVTSLTIVLLAMTLGPAAGGRKEPPPPLPAVVQALKPSGLRISILDEEGIDLVIVNANINVPLELKETGQMTKTVLRAKDGFWTMETDTKPLKPNDVIFYWVYSSIGGKTRNIAGRHIIGELVDPSCRPSVTTVNGSPACRGALVFEDNFDTLNKTAWKHNIQFFGETDVEFTEYVTDAENSYVKDGVLFLKPTAVADEEELKTPRKLEGCTAKSGGEYCDRTPLGWNILPPGRSAWLTSTMGFRFGRVEVRAKTASGDWLDSRAYLEPRDYEYGKADFQSGRIDFMRVRGNPDLRHGDGDNYGANQNRGHLGMFTCRLVFFYHWNKYISKGLYSDAFHTYAVTWTPRHIRYEVDGKVVSTTTPPMPNGFLGTDAYKNCNNSPWEKGTFMAPFDKEYNINLSLLIGGYHNFGNGDKSGEHVKAWRDRTPQATADFWRSRDDWLPTWKQDLQIDSVKVYAL